MGFFSWLWDVIKKIARFVVNVIRGLLNFTQHIVKWFQGLPLLRGRHIPFIANAKSEEGLRISGMGDALGSARRENVGIFKGVYDEATETIIKHEVVAADELDARTKQILGNEALVVLE